MRVDKTFISFDFRPIQIILLTQSPIEGKHWKTHNHIIYDLHTSSIKAAAIISEQ